MAVNNGQPATTSFAHWTKTAGPSARTSLQNRRAPPGESGGRARRRTIGAGDEPQALAREPGMRPLASGPGCGRLPRRSARNRRLRGSPGAVARSSGSRTPTPRCACRPGRVLAALDSRDATSGGVLGGGSSTGKADRRRSSTRWRRHSGGTGRDPGADGRHRRHDECRSSISLRSRSALAGHRPRLRNRLSHQWSPSMRLRATSAAAPCSSRASPAVRIPPLWQLTQVRPGTAFGNECSPVRPRSTGRESSVGAGDPTRS